MRLNEIGQQLRAYRLESGMRAEEIAARLGVSRAALYRYEKGEVREMLLAQRRAHPARTLSLVAADLLGPTAVGTNAAVVCAMLSERIAAGNRPVRARSRT